MDEIMLKVDNVSKMYKLGQIGGTTLRDELQRLGAKLRHKEDPTQKIGAKSHTKNETFMALNGVSFEVKKGERVGIIGHNGAGKSTLLKLISRITAPTGGTISMNGRVASMLEVGTGFNGELTGRENIYMNGAILGMTKKEIDAKMEDIIEFSECRQFIDTPVKRYSSGMYVKLAFSVAAHLDSEIMIMDEVLAVGDMAFQKKCLDKMNEVSREEGRTILYVSHNMNTIRELCNRVIVLNRGNILFDGEVEEGISYYNSSSSSLFETYYDVSEVRRPSPQHGSIAKITSFTFLDKENAVFPANEPLSFRMVLFSSTYLSALNIRLVLKSSYDPIGMAQTVENICIEPGFPLQLDFSLTLDSLSAGTYYFEPDLYVLNDAGRHLSYDHPLVKIYFSIQEAEGYKGLIWNKQSYGSINFPRIRLLNKKN